MMRIIFPFLTITLLLYSIQSFPQISPGDLAAPHAHLEGMSNCTQCHILGAKVSSEKCLKCHTEIKERLDQNKGYHSSDPVKAKECVVCHNDHHGRNFKIILFSEDRFDHNLTGYKLEGAHNELNCNECHRNEFIKNPKLKAKKSTYLGLNTSCLTCHDDYHQNTLSTNCTDCHHFENFKPAPKFNHNNSRYQLKGKHQDVTCVKCHKLTIHNGKPFQEFKGISFGNCNSCHADVHQDQFGQDCRQCHQEESFQLIKGLSNFDHNKTNFRLEGRHQTVNCKSCHKSKLTDPLKHKLCTDCHTDYHQGQFAVNGSSPDCSECHNTMGFSGSSFTIEKHNSGLFPLEGAHLATPCFACHKKKDRWNFRKIGFDCKDCHPDIHQHYLDKKYYPDENCKNCHTVTRWDEVTFDHSRTNFVLTGAHSNQA